MTARTPARTPAVRIPRPMNNAIFAPFLRFLRSGSFRCAAWSARYPTSAFRLLKTSIRGEYPPSPSGSRLAPGREVNRPVERDETRFLDPFRERRMRGHAVGDSLDRRLGVERDDGGLDEVGRVRSDDHDPEQLAVRRLVDRLHPAAGLAGHDRARVRDPREAADRHVLAVLLA